MFEVMFQQLINWHSEFLVSYSHFMVSNVTPALCLGWVLHVSEGKWSLVKTTDIKPLKNWTSDINCYQNIKIILFFFFSCSCKPTLKRGLVCLDSRWWWCHWWWRAKRREGVPGTSGIYVVERREGCLLKMKCAGYIAMLHCIYR